MSRPPFLVFASTLATAVALSTASSVTWSAPQAAATGAESTGTGSAWGDPVMVDPSQDGHGRPTDVSCASHQRCVLVDAAGFFSIDRGGTWSLPVTLDPLDQLEAVVDTSVSCASDDFCVAVGSTGHEPDGAGFAAVFDGSGWSEPAVISDFGLADVACTSPAFCFAVDSGGRVLQYDGADWSAPVKVVPTDEALTSVSCVKTFCMAVDDAGQAYTFRDAGPWSPPTHSFRVAAIDVSCLTGGPRNECIVIDDLGRVHYWISGAGMGQGKHQGFRALSCHSSSFCMAVVGGGQARQFSGIDWYDRVTIDDGHRLRAVSCPTTHFCAAVDGGGRAILYSAG